jgi:hypothetical protein
VEQPNYYSLPEYRGYTVMQHFSLEIGHRNRPGKGILFSLDNASLDTGMNNTNHQQKVSSGERSYGRRNTPPYVALTKCRLLAATYTSNDTGSAFLGKC